VRGPIEARIAALRGQVRRLLALHGLSWLVFGLTLAVLVAGSADWLIHLAPEVRLALLICVIGLGAWLAVTRVLLPLIVRFADLDIALRIEDRWPGLNDRLASTVQFLRQARGDESLGSQALRDATVEQTLAEVESIDFREVADSRSTRKALLWATLAVALVGTIGTVEPHLSGIAFKRLFRPFGPDRWPQATHLTVVESETPKKIARGMPFSLVVAVAPGERLPASARVTFRYPDGETATEPLRPTEDGTFRGRIETVAVPFSFTVEAGDDVTPPWSVAVVPPPSLVKTAVRVIAPAYTALASQTLAPGNTQVRAVEGTKIEFEAVANKPIASAILRRGEAVATESVKVGGDALGLSTAFVVKDSQPFWLELKDTEGFASQEAVRFDVRVVKDEAPRVAVDEPSHDREVPAEATVPLQFTIDDDYGIQLVRLVYKVAAGHSEPTGELIIPLWAAPEPHGEGGPIKHREVKFNWELSTLKDLQPGSIITFYADARDFDNLKGPNLGRSREMRLRIVSKEDVDRLLEEQLRAIREEADRILAIQKQAKTPVDDALRTLSRTNKLPEPLRDQIKNAEIIQRQVNNRVTNKADGLEQKIRQYQQDTKDFKVNNPDTDRQMAAMREAVERIEDRNLNPADQSLNRATKSFEPQPDGGNAPKPSDNPAAQNQEAKPSQDQPGDQAKGDQAKNEAGAQSKGDQAKSQAGSQPKGQQAKGDQAKDQAGDQAKGDQAKNEAGDQPKGDQAKSQAGAQSKGNQSKKNQAGKSSKGQQAKGDSPKDQAGGDQAKGEDGQPEGGDQAKGEPQSKGQAGQAKAASKSSSPKASSKAGGEKSPQGQAKEQAPTTPKEALAEAQENQKAIIDELEQMRDSLSRFDEVKDAIKDAKGLLKQQEQAAKAAAEAAGKPDMMGKPQEALSPEQKADLANQAAKQNEIAKGVQNLQNKIENMASKLEGTDPLSARALKDAAEQTRKQATAAKMGEVADQLEKNQMGQARAGQEHAQRDLKKMIAEMEDRRGKELSRLVAELKAAEADLKKLRNEQAANLKKTQEARQNPDPQKRADELKQLAKEQKKLQEELDKQMAKLAKINNQAGARPGQKAAEAMAKAQGNLEQDDAEKAEGEEEEALEDLKQAQQEVAQARKEAEEQLAMEQIAKMKDALASIGERQNKMVEETDRYEKSRAENDGKLTLAQRTGVKDLGRVQAGLKDETTELIDQLGEGAPVFGLTLKKAAAGMETAAQRLQALKTDEPTVKAEKLASARFKQLVDSLKPDKAKPGRGQQPGEQGGDQQPGEGGAQRGGDGIPAAAQIKMLKSLQEELNERTDFFDELLRRHKELNPDQTAELDRLHEDQGTIADLVRDLTKPKKDDGEQ
jgi:hypothetical protein